MSNNPSSIDRLVPEFEVLIGGSPLPPGGGAGCYFGDGPSGRGCAG